MSLGWLSLICFHHTPSQQMKRLLSNLISNQDFLTWCWKWLVKFLGFYFIAFQSTYYLTWNNCLGKFWDGQKICLDLILWNMRVFFLLTQRICMYTLEKPQCTPSPSQQLDLFFWCECSTENSIGHIRRERVKNGVIIIFKFEVAFMNVNVYYSWIKLNLEPKWHEKNISHL